MKTYLFEDINEVIEHFEYLFEDINEVIEHFEWVCALL